MTDNLHQNMLIYIVVLNIFCNHVAPYNYAPPPCFTVNISLSYSKKKILSHQHLFVPHFIQQITAAQSFCVQKNI